MFGVSRFFSTWLKSLKSLQIDSTWVKVRLGFLVLKAKVKILYQFVVNQHNYTILVRKALNCNNYIPNMKYNKFYLKSYQNRSKHGKNSQKSTWNRLDQVESPKIDFESVVRNQLDSTWVDWLRILLLTVEALHFKFIFQNHW